MLPKRYHYRRKVGLSKNIRKIVLPKRPMCPVRYDTVCMSGRAPTFVAAQMERLAQMHPRALGWPSGRRAGVFGGQDCKAYG